jgi:arylsulfatase
VLGLAVGLAGCAGPEPARNLVLISLDTVRRDHVSAYGYERETTPAIDALAARGAVFETAVSQQTNTNPSHGSMLTGLYPHQHGSLFNRFPVAEEQVTLAELLRDAGFRTGGFVSGLPLKRPLTGLEQGFERFDDRFEEQRRDGRETVGRALEWLETVEPGERFFLFLHLYDAHGPYELPEGIGHRFRSEDRGPRLPRVPPYQRLERPGGGRIVHLGPYVDRYDSLIRYQDDQVARLFDRLAAGGMAPDETVIVVLSDHGEVLGERYWPLDHGATAFDEELRIPLIVAGPGIEPRRIGETVETVDLLPTVLELLAVEPGDPDPAGAPAGDRGSLPGRSLVPLLHGEEGSDAARPAYSCSRAETRRMADRGYRLEDLALIRSVRTRGWKLIRYPAEEGEPYVELYDLRRDPGETTDVADRHPEVRDRLLAGLEAWWSPPAPSGPVPTELPETIQRQLRSLGYLGGPADGTR